MTHTPSISRLKSLLARRFGVTSRLCALGVALWAFAGGAIALPMGSQGTTMWMFDGSGDATAFSVNYAFTRQDALGIALGRWEEKPHANAPAMHALRRDYVALKGTRLLHRWNLPHAQANLWAVGHLGTARVQSGFGAAPISRSNETLWAVAGLADYETTRLYAAASQTWHRASRARHDTTSLRAGFAFVEADYESIQPWMIVELKRERWAHTAKDSATALLRLIHRQYFVEVGGNRDGAVLNLMFNH